MADEDEPDWMIEHELKEKRKIVLQNRKEFESRLARIRANEKKTKARYVRGEPLHKRQVKFRHQIRSFCFVSLKSFRKGRKIKVSSRRENMETRPSICLMIMRVMTK